MNDWDKDRRLNGGDGWGLDESGEWVPKTPGAAAKSSRAPATNRRPSRREVSQPAPVTEPAPVAPQAAPMPMQLPPQVVVAAPPQPRSLGLFGALIVSLVLPAMAASATLYVWKGPGAEAALALIEPYVEPFVERIIELSSTGAEGEVATEPQAGDPCEAVHRGMGGSIVFHRTGGC